MGDQFEGSHHGSFTSGECSKKSESTVAKQVGQFRAQILLERQPSMDRNVCKIGPSGLGSSNKADESNSMGVSLNLSSEVGKGVIKKLGVTVRNSVSPEPMEDIVSKKGDGGSAQDFVGASVQVGDHATRKGHNKVVMEEDRMDFDGRGEAASAI